MARPPYTTAGSPAECTGPVRPLLQRLDAEARSIILVSGPAGSGKSTFAEAWAARVPNVRRLTVGRRHNEAALLREAISDALGVHSAYLADHGDQDSWPGWLEHRLANASRPDEPPTSLILDRAELVADPDAQLLLSDLCEFLPRSLRLLVTTRQRFPAWLTRSRAAGAVAVVNAADLQLTAAEARAIAGDAALGLNGWALGVGLMAELGPPAAHEAIRDYFRAEVMSHQTSEMRSLLYAVSLADEVEPALALRLSGNPEVGRLLAEFAATTQLVTVSPGPTFRVHPVLARCLVEDFAAEAWPHHVAARHRHAQWLADQGRLDQATGVLLGLDATAQARASLLHHWQRSVLAGQAVTVRAALDMLPPGELANDPRLCMVKAMSHVALGDHDGWQRWLDVSQAHDSSAELDPGISVGTAIAVCRRFTQAITLGVGSEPEEFGPVHGLWGALSWLAGGVTALWDGRYVEAEQQFRHAEVAARISGDRLAIVYALSGLALIAAMEHDGDAIALADEAIAAADQLPAPCQWVVANAYLALAVTHHASGAERAARSAAVEAANALRTVSRQVERHTRELASSLLDEQGASRRVSSAHRLSEHTDAMPGSSSTLEDRELSARERRVLRALCGPLTLREIADELYVSRNTIKTQVAAIFRKLQVHDRAAAVAAARSRSLVTR